MYVCTVATVNVILSMDRRADCENLCVDVLCVCTVATVTVILSMETRTGCCNLRVDVYIYLCKYSHW